MTVSENLWSVRKNLITDKMIQALDLLEKRTRVIKVRLEAIETKMTKLKESKPADTGRTASPEICSREKRHRCGIGQFLLMFCVFRLLAVPTSEAGSSATQSPCREGA